jgi:DNA-binding PadR family transcriptional regulator
VAVLGELEQIMLLALLRLGSGTYGVPLRDEIERQTGRDLTLGTVHKTLARLEGKGFVASWMGEPSAHRGGRRKRHYEITLEGRRAVRHSLRTLRDLAGGLDLGLESP